jgi:tetratricopeptide (TPR) repeat protein
VLLLGVLLVPGLVGAGVYWQRQRTLERQLVQARAAIGTRSADGQLERLVQESPQCAEAWWLHARQARLAEKSSAASADLKRAAELGWPQSEVDRELLLVAAQTDFRRAEPQLQARLERHPRDPDTLLALAVGYQRAGNVARALATVEPILARDPDHGPALCLRGRLYLQQRHLDKALADLEKALACEPERLYAPSARLLQAICLLDLGRFEEALHLFRECQADEPDNPKALYGIGRCARFLNRPDEAAAAFEAVLRLRPDHLETLLQLAYIDEERGQLAEALHVLEHAEQLDPYWYEIPFRMAKILTALGLTERAARYQNKYDAMRERWLKRLPGQTVQQIFHLPEEPSFPSNLLP